MIGISAWDYVYIRTCIFLLHLIAPLGVIYSLVSCLIHPPFYVPHVLEVWLNLEAVFYLLVYLPRKTYLQTVVTHPTAGRDDRRRLFWRCHSNIPDPERYLAKWFRDAPVAEIRRENVKDFFRWAFLNSGEPDPAYDEELEEYIGEMEKLLGRKLEPGRGVAQCLRLTLDKVEMLHRSLIWYLRVFVVDALASMYLRFYSFDFHRTSLLQFLAVFPTRILNLFNSYRSPARTLTYWYRPHTSRTRLPVLFIHGIGVGLYSYGSVVATHLLRKPQIASKIGPTLFVDPVSFLLHLPDVAYNFICRKPTNASEHLLSYFGAKDLGVAHTLFRRFTWSDNVLWKEDIQHHRVAVVLAGRDAIVDTNAVAAYLTGTDDWALETESWENGIWKGDGLDVLWFQDLDHGEVFSRRRTRKRLVDIISRFAADE
ncbi:ribose-phosphate pyrophosphokinase [Trichoderma arundinaceum]|uniref:Ribose-phosphate pyrophosphokinase n=1 Tax=Trichoderma arundinaceum TaxID=490622 RepID=A0A395NS93_TRIAR|nr:ribose-phosphate pyrophosphokinase [Trichoderma arundinaceum]